MWPGPYGEFGSRKYLLASLDQSLTRMGVDYVDVFYSHRPDPETPLEETTGALDAAVRSGKALYAGISSYSAERTAEAARILAEMGTPLFIHQPSYSMLNRWIEEDLLDASTLQLLHTRQVVVGLMHLEPPTGLTAELMLTDPIPNDVTPEAVTFSGGVSEYIYSREPGSFHDLGPALGAGIRAALDGGAIGLPLLDPGQGIRATVIGASQFSMQLSGNTIAISDDAELPLRNLPVLHPKVDLAGEFTSAEIAGAISQAITRFATDEGVPSVALSFRWQGDPLYQRLRTFADGIVQGLAESIAERKPVVLLLDGDIGKTLGNILKSELQVPSDVVSIDGLQLQEFDFVDIGEVIQPANAVPVVIKSLLFSSAPGKAQDQR